MVDREKVIRAVDSCFDYWLDQHRCLKPLELEHIRQYKAEALALLKEQEPVPPDVDFEGTCSCGNCGTTVGYYPVGCKTPEKLCKFCPECGKAVKWDG